MSIIRQETAEVAIIVRLTLGTGHRQPCLVTFGECHGNDRRGYDIAERRRIGAHREINEAVEQGGRGQLLVLLAHMPTAIRAPAAPCFDLNSAQRSEAHTSELQPLMPTSSSVFRLKNKNNN